MAGPGVRAHQYGSRKEFNRFVCVFVCEITDFFRGIFERREVQH